MMEQRICNFLHDTCLSTWQLNSVSLHMVFLVTGANLAGLSLHELQNVASYDSATLAISVSNKCG